MGINLYGVQKFVDFAGPSYSLKITLDYAMKYKPTKLSLLHKNLNPLN